MSAIPSVLSSAQTVLSTGFSRLDKATAQIASSTTSDATDPTAPAQDPMVNGIVDTFQARAEVDSGVALLHTFQQVTNDLMEMSDPYPRYRHIDLYA